MELERTGIPLGGNVAGEVVARVVAVAEVVAGVEVVARAAAERAEEIALPRADSATLATS